MFTLNVFTCVCCLQKTKLTLQQAYSMSILDKQFPPATCTPEIDSSASKDNVYENFKFPIPPKLQSGEGRPADKTVHKFIRDCVACLQASYGSNNIETSVLTTAATKICDCVPAVRDPKPPSFYNNKGFPYWVSNIL